MFVLCDQTKGELSSERKEKCETLQQNFHKLLQTTQTLAVSFHAVIYLQPSVGFHSMLRHCWLGDRKSIRPVKKLGVGLLVVVI